MGDVNEVQETAEEKAAREAETAREAVLEPLRKKHGEIAWYDVPGFGLVVAAKPENPSEYKVFADNITNEKMSKATTMESFAIACTVYPADREVVKRIYRTWPAFVTTVAGRGQKLCGAGIQEMGKG